MQDPRSKTIMLSGERDLAKESIVTRAIPADDESLKNCHLQLDFANVDYISSLDLGALVGLHRRMQSLGGKLTLLNVHRDIYETFKVTRLDTLLDIRA